MKVNITVGHVLIFVIVAVAGWFIYKGWSAAQGAPPAA